MRSCHDLSRVSVTFDEANLVPCAGLLPAAVLAQRLDVAGVVEDRLTLPRDGAFSGTKASGRRRDRRGGCAKYLRTVRQSCPVSRAISLILAPCSRKARNRLMFIHCSSCSTMEAGHPSSRRIGP